MPLRLTVYAPDQPGRPFLLHPGHEYRIGRAEDAEIRIDDERVSRIHASLSEERGVWRIRDLCSKNGVRLDGLPIAGARLDALHWLSIGGIPVCADAEPTLVEAAPLRESVRAATTADPDAMVTHVLDLLRRVADCERMALWTVDDAGEPREFRSVGPAEPAPSLGTIRTVLETGQPVFCSDTEGAAALARRESIVAGNIRAVVAVPAGHGAAVYGHSVRPGKLFTQTDAELIAGHAEQLALIVAASGVRAALGHVGIAP